VTRRDWTLLAIAAAGGRPLTPVQLQKALFILGKEKRDRLGPAYYKFRPYNYGPFSPDVYVDADVLDSMGLVDVDPGSPTRSWSTYRATPEGLEKAKQLRSKAPLDAAKYIEAVVAWARKLSFQELVSAVYDRYPEQRVNSIFIQPSRR
jgi:uncharacterized protein YwgA